MVRGPTLGIVLVYLWAAYPFTLWSMNSNTNDTLVGMLVVGALLGVRWAPVRGSLAALAGLTKFAPFALGPLLLRGTGGWRPARYTAVVSLVAPHLAVELEPSPPDAGRVILAGRATSLPFTTVPTGHERTTTDNTTATVTCTNQPVPR